MSFSANECTVTKRLKIFDFIKFQEKPLKFM